MRIRALLVTTVAVLSLSGWAYNASAHGDGSWAPQWIQRFDDPTGDADWPADVVVAPDGSLVYLAGASGTSDPDVFDFATLAYDAVTGARVWRSQYNGPANGNDSASAIAPSPTGDRLFVTGVSEGADAQQGWATLAYDARTGAREWIARLENPHRFTLYGPSAVAVTNDGSTVIVAGAFSNEAGVDAWTTVAYDARSGRQRWVTYEDNGSGGPTALTLSPDGTLVYVAGSAGGYAADFATVAYDVRTGAWRSSARYSSHHHEYGAPADIAVTPDGSTVIVTGDIFTTVAYPSDLSSELWVATYDGEPGDWGHSAAALDVSPDGSLVAVAGTASGLASDFVTITYDTATGTQLWLARPSDEALDSAHDVAYRPDGASLFVTGVGGDDFATVEYDAVTGEELRAAWLDGPAHDIDTALDLAVDPDGSMVFVAGEMDFDYLNIDRTNIGTVAYPIG